MASWIDDALLNLQQGAAPQVGALGASPFPDVSAPAAIDEAALAAAAREAAGKRLIAANQKRIDPFAFPNADSGGISLALGDAPAGTGVPGNTNFAMGVPPSVQLASSLTQPQQPSQPPQGQVSLPMPRPPEADAPTDVSAVRRGAPMGMPANNVDAPAAVAFAAQPIALPALASAAPTSFSDTLKGFAPALLGVGGALQGDGGAMTSSLLKTQRDQDQQQQTANFTARALLAKGAPAEDVMAGLKSPELLKALVGQYYGKDKFKVVKTGQDEFGGEKYSLFNEQDGTFKPVPGTSGANGGAEGGSSTSGYLAPGVSTVDKSLAGEDYLNQYSPEVQAAVKDYLAGRTQPTSNPRKGWVQNIKSIAQKYGSDIGTPADDAAFGQRRAFSNSLGNTNTGVGAQAKGFQQGLSHMTELAEKLEKLGNVNGLGIAPLAHGVNAVRGWSTSQADTRKSVDAASQALAGEIGKLYSGSSGSGVHERQATKALFGQNLSGPELAGALESTLELMHGGLKSIEQRRDDLFPTGNYPKGANFVGPEQDKQIAHIRDIIARLRGGQSAPASAPVTSGKTNTGISWSVN